MIGCDLHVEEGHGRKRGYADKHGDSGTFDKGRENTIHLVRLNLALITFADLEL